MATVYRRHKSTHEDDCDESDHSISLFKIEKKINYRKIFQLILLILLLFFFMYILFSFMYVYPFSETKCIQSIAGNLKSYNKNAVSSDSSICSLIGCNIMNLHNGNIVDAAIATSICTAVVNFHSTSIAGGGFVIYKASNTTPIFIDFRETAPSSARDQLYQDKILHKTDGTGSVGVPGMIKGLYELWGKYGKLPWKKLLEPSIKLASEGFPLGKSLISSINRVLDRLDSFPELKKLLTNNKTARYYEEGDLFKNQKLANTLIFLSRDPENFYHEDISKSLIYDFCDTFKKEYFNLTKRIPCPLKLSDFERYETISGSVKTNKFSSLPYETNYFDPPHSGVVLNFMTSVGEQLKYLNNKNERYYHEIAEIMKWAYAKRSYLGDPFSLLNESLYQQTISFLANASIIKNVAKNKITENTHNLDYYESFNINSEQKTGTSHLSVMDTEGNAISMTTTTNYYFGSLVLSPSTGIIFNNEMDDFSLRDDVNLFDIHTSINNFIYPGKRPMSSMTPTIILSSETQEPILSIGASGGSMITTALFQAIMDILIFNTTIEEAIHKPRIHHQYLPNKIVFDDKFPIDETLQKDLIKRGHIVEETKMFAAVQGIIRLGNILQGAADPRKDGSVYGN